MWRAGIVLRTALRSPLVLSMRDTAVQRQRKRELAETFRASGTDPAGTPLPETPGPSVGASAANGASSETADPVTNGAWPTRGITRALSEPSRQGYSVPSL